jgi:peroxiredoxin Q/BCP
MARKPSKRSVRKSSKPRKSSSRNKIKRSKAVKSKAKGSARKKPASRKPASRSKVASKRPAASKKRAVPAKKKPVMRAGTPSPKAKPARPKAPAKLPTRGIVAPRSTAPALPRTAAGGGRGANPGRSAKSNEAAQATLEFEVADPTIVEKVHVDPTPVMPKRRSSKVGGPDWPGENLTVGMPAPEFSLPSTLGRKVSLSEFRGKRVILYFYPKDDTPGCTQEACAFRDNLSRIQAKDAVVLGISLDDELSHQRFAQKYSLTFPLLSDMDAAVCRQYGVYKEKNLYGRSFWGIERTTFAIDREGKVENVFRRVKVEGHADEVLATLAV